MKRYSGFDTKTIWNFKTDDRLVPVECGKVRTSAWTLSTCWTKTFNTQVFHMFTCFFTWNKRPKGRRLKGYVARDSEPQIIYHLQSDLTWQSQAPANTDANIQDWAVKLPLPAASDGAQVGQNFTVNRSKKTLKNRFSFMQHIAVMSHDDAKRPI